MAFRPATLFSSLKLMYGNLRFVRRGHGRVGRREPGDVVPHLDVRRLAGDDPVLARRPHLPLVPPVLVPRQQGHARHQHGSRRRSLDGRLQGAIFGPRAAHSLSTAGQPINDQKTLPR